MNKILFILKLLRPAQWIKNSFVFLPVFLSGNLTERTPLLMSCLAFLLFCLTSSAIYCINDSIDAHYDALNPDKCQRPVASGALSRWEALTIAGILLIVTFCSTVFSGVSELRPLVLPLGAYFILNLAYSLYLKRIAVIDVLIISICFLLRVWTGGLASGVPITQWTLALVFLLTLLLAIGKRRHEAWLCENKGIVSRSNIKYYNVRVLNYMLVLIAAVALAAYFIWIESEYVSRRFESDALPLTTIFVAIGIGRYLWLLICKDKGGSPTRILIHDNVIRFSVLAWILSFLFFIYFRP